jgi:uncharacterized membrane protein YkvA (DUF1232 family)
MAHDTDYTAPPDFQSTAPVNSEIYNLNYNRVQRSFWSKLNRVAAKIPFADNAVALYICAVDSTTSIRIRAAIFAAHANFVVPTDMIPDFLAGIGYSDDASVITAVISLVAKHILPSHRARASQILKHDVINIYPPGQ